MAATPSTIVCEYQGEHSRIDERLEQLEDRANKHDKAIEKLSDLASGVNGRLERIDGKIEGALAASKISGAVIGALVSAGASGAVALVIFLLGRR